MLRHKKAQSLNEYAMVIALITIAGIGMQAYIKRGIQSVIKISADNLASGGRLDQGSLPPIPEDGPLAEADLHLAAKAYKERVGGFVSGERRGNTITYYHFTSDPDDKLCIGKEDARTHDFTGFDLNGFANGVVDKNNVAYADLTFTLNEDPVTHEVTSVTVKKRVGAIYVELGTYGKYELVKVNDWSSPDALAQQKGIKEVGLYKFNQTPPLTVTINKSITVKQHALKATDISHWTIDGRSNWHPVFERDYFGRGRARVPIVERTGNDVYYYDYPTLADAEAKTNGITVGGEDAITRDFTTFGPEGYPDVVFDKDGHAYDIEFIRTRNEAGEIISVTDTQGNTYSKYQIVRISTTPAPPESALPALPIESSGIRETIINNDQTQVSGGWEATYKLENANTFSKSDRTNKATNPSSSPKTD